MDRLDFTEPVLLLMCLKSRSLLSSNSSESLNPRFRNMRTREWKRYQRERVPPTPGFSAVSDPVPGMRTRGGETEADKGLIIELASQDSEVVTERHVTFQILQ